MGHANGVQKVKPAKHNEDSKFQFTPFRHVQGEEDKLRHKMWEVEQEINRLKDEKSHS